MKKSGETRKIPLGVYRKINNSLSFVATTIRFAATDLIMLIFHYFLETGEFSTSTYSKGIIDFAGLFDTNQSSAISREKPRKLEATSNYTGNVSHGDFRRFFYKAAVKSMVNTRTCLRTSHKGFLFRIRG